MCVVLVVAVSFSVLALVGLRCLVICALRRAALSPSPPRCRRRGGEAASSARSAAPPSRPRPRHRRARRQVRRRWAMSLQLSQRARIAHSWPLCSCSFAGSFGREPPPYVCTTVNATSAPSAPSHNTSSVSTKAPPAILELTAPAAPSLPYSDHRPDWRA